MHVKREGNRVANAMANAGVESEFFFHAETTEDDGKTQQIWSNNYKLANEDARQSAQHSA